jgi:hypothetical protein
VPHVLVLWVLPVASRDEVCPEPGTLHFVPGDDFESTMLIPILQSGYQVQGVHS